MDNRFIHYPTIPPNTGLSVYATVTRFDGYKWNGIALVPYTGVVADFARLVEHLGFGHYRYTIPSNLPSDHYVFQMYIMIGAAPDLAVDQEVVFLPEYWDGRSLGIMNEIIAPVTGTGTWASSGTFSMGTDEGFVLEPSGTLGT